MFSHPQFNRARRLALTLSGVELLDRHQELLLSRGRRLGLVDEAAWESLLLRAEAGEPAAVRQFTKLATTGFTAFFRHPEHFEAAARQALHAVRKRCLARLWSAAAATGQEPFSLAMALLDAFGNDNPPVRILATDIDTESLAVAEQGEYSEDAVKTLEPERREKFLQPTPSFRWSVAPVVRRLLEIRQVNLAQTTWPVTGPFDVIFCRNVLMYLEAGHRYAVLERMASLLEPDGLLFLDPTEHLGNAGHWFAPGARGVFARRSGQPVSRRVASRRTPAVV